MRRLPRIVALLVGLALAGLIGIGFDIVLYAGQSDNGRADAAIVLGAAVYDDRPTPVFEERLRHAAALQQSGRVRVIVVTGGRGPGDTLAESKAGREWLVAAGVAPEAILVETESRTTRQNFIFALPLFAENSIGRALIVSDPLHMRRAVRMALDLGIDAHPSPTPTSRYQSLGTQLPMLAREIWFTLNYLFRGE
jgi:uncharacterized SAM-binding protein YcdF (DUF218 family)